VQLLRVPSSFKMQSFMRMLTDFYKDINPSNLSGAIDVVVIEDVKTGELRCSPFHVRFGKGQVFSKPSERRVELIVNDQVVDGLEMRIGEAGEAYFLLNEEGGMEPVIAEVVLSTSSPPKASSPLHQKALSDPEVSPASSPIKLTEPLSDSEVNYQKGAMSEEGSPMMPKSPDWDWQWGDLPVHRNNQAGNNLDNNNGADSHRFGPLKYLDVVAFLQTARNIEHVHRRLAKTTPDWRCSVMLLKVPLRLHSPQQLLRSFEDCLRDSLDRIIDDDSDLLRLLDPKSVARLVVRFAHPSSPEPCYLAGKVALHVAVTVAVLSLTPSLPTILKLAEEPLEDDKGQKEEPQTTRSWRSWWSRSPASPTLAMDAASVSTKALVQGSAPSAAQVAAQKVKGQKGPGQDGRTPSMDVPRMSPSAPPTPQQHPSPPLKSLRLNSEQLRRLKLRGGVNSIVFSVGGSNGRLYCSSRIVKWPSTAKIVVSDIDGTITKSDALGHLFAMVGKDWTHSGVASLYTAIARNGYQFLYLTSRSIGQSYSTQKYLRGIEQEKNQLPDGPIIMSPDRLFAAFKRELIVGNPEEFKIAALRDIQNLFPPTASGQPFYAGFGNRITDAQSYHAVGVPPSRIFSINSSGSVWVEQLLGAGGVFASTTYLAMADIVDLYFPPAHTAPRDIDDAFSDLNWWRTTRWSDEDLGILPPMDKVAVLGIGEDLVLIGNRSLTAAPEPRPRHDLRYGQGSDDDASDFTDEDESTSATPFPYI
jgi:phosphatidate phosphatase PAH1